MKADEQAFYNFITSMSRDEVDKLAFDQYVTIRKMADREKANSRINTEMTIQYNDLLTRYEAVCKELDDIKVLYQKEIDKNILKTRSVFGRKTEKTLDLISDTLDKSDEFEDESDTEDTDDNCGKSSGCIIPFPEGKSPKKSGSKKSSGSSKPRGKNALKESMDNLPHKPEYDIDIESLNQRYGEGKWSISYWNTHETIERIETPYYVRVIHTPVICTGTEHSQHVEPYANLLMHHSYASASIVSDILYRKFFLGFPFHRQAADYAMNGLLLSKQVNRNATADAMITFGR